MGSKIIVDKSLLMYPVITKTIIKRCKAKKITREQRLIFYKKKKAFKVLENNTYDVIINKVDSRYAIEVEGGGGFVTFTIPLNKLSYFVKEMKKKGIKLKK